MENRVIKFRIIYRGKVNGYEKLTPEGWQWMALDLNPDNGKERWTRGVFPWGFDYIRNQFTGLLDKNEKEIYEGDIMTCHTNNKFQYPHKGEVIYLQHICGFGITTEPIANEATGEDEPAFTYFNYNENFEVIGNIFTTPELIKQESK